MKLIYKARDIIEAHIISGLLQSKGIDTHVGGFYLQGGIGDLAAMDFATVSVADENTKVALSIIAEYEIKANIDTSAGPSEDRSKSIFIFPIIIVAISVIMILLLAISFSNYS